MSHTGTIIRPTQSPGLIRVITTGYVVTRGRNKKLTFRKPAEGQNLLEAAQERFILIHPKAIQSENKIIDSKNNESKYKFATKNDLGVGNGVIFNLKNCYSYVEELSKEIACLKKIKDKNEEDIKSLNKLVSTKKKIDKYRDDVKNIYRNKIRDFEFLRKLDPGIGNLYENIIKKQLLEDIENFKFKYMTTEVRSIPKEFVLQLFFETLKPLDDYSMEKLIDGVKGINHYKFRDVFKVYCFNRRQKQTEYNLTEMEVLSAVDFDEKYGKPDDPGKRRKNKGVEVYESKVCDNVDVEIKISENKEHKISTVEEIPSLRILKGV